MQTAPRFPIRAEKIKKTDMEFVHKSVLFDESIKALELNKNKLIVDGTAGGGGHAREIAKQAGRLIAVDQDPDAVKVLSERLAEFPNVTIVHDNFSNIKTILSSLGISGELADSRSGLGTYHIGLIDALSLLSEQQFSRLLKLSCE